jgi:heme/copper-type cytochrome/quinol oxidase subunit 2
LPAMRIAQDAIPGSLIPFWFRPIKTGTYEVICGQLCGLGHYSMKGSLVVDTPADYQAWLKERAEMSASAAAPPPTARPPGEPSIGPTPGTIPPAGAPQNPNLNVLPHASPAAPAPSPKPGG